jgi:hypothetical protein
MRRILLSTTALSGLAFTPVAIPGAAPTSGTTTGGPGAARGIPRGELSF